MNMDSNIPDDALIPWWDIEVPDTDIYGSEESEQLQFAPYMERDDSGSSYTSYSSNNTTRTFGSLDSNSSFSSYGSFIPQATSSSPSSGYTIHQDYSPVGSVSGSASLYNYQLPAYYNQTMSKPLFDIERDGDPNISWWMYYDFHVGKEGAYHILQPGYLPSEKFPVKRFSEKEYEKFSPQMLRAKMYIKARQTPLRPRAALHHCARQRKGRAPFLRLPEVQAQRSLRPERSLSRALPGVPPRRPRKEPAKRRRAMARGQERRGELVEMLEMPEAESNGERVEVRWRLQADVREIEDYCEEVETE
ncbi:hypothetical protein V497_06140 [Pseudogymnoascus sp. VKM F-4516 (FW-969)]|nr:hypothetical protein V497_06140 [Pseudogymnoascus sp. VKM F-4516 (FW-969)]